jgi:leader peptidase (prepilin peptidase)/N-methyltransferase
MRSRLGTCNRCTFVVFGVIAAAAVIGSLLAAPPARGFCGAGLAVLMLVIARHDARHFIIPNAFAAAAFALAIVHAAVSEPGMMAQAIGLALLRAAALAGAFLALKLGYRSLRGREGLGMGDVKLAGIAGAWLDWLTMLVAIDIAVVAALGSYLVRQHVKQRPLRRGSALPFGLFLAPAIWIGWLLETTQLAQ